MTARAMTLRSAGLIGCWIVAIDNRNLGVIERSPAGNFLAFAGEPEKCLGVFEDLEGAGEAIVFHHGLAVEVIA